MAGENTDEDSKVDNNISTNCNDKNNKTVDSAQEYEDRYRTLYDNVPVGIYRSTSSGKLVSANPVTVHMFGYDNEEDLLANRDKDLFEDPGDREIAFGRLSADGKIADFEARFQRKDGTLFWGSISARLIMDKDGESAFFDGIIQDITDRKQSQEAIRNSERRLADIINFLPDATFVIDTDGKVVAWNRAIEELSGVRAEDMVGKGDYEYAVPFYGVRRPVLIDLALRWDEKIAKEYSYVDKKGDILVSETINPPFTKGPSCFWNSARKLYNIHGEIIGAIEVIRDISERKMAELAIIESEERFRSLVSNIPGAVYRCGQDANWTMHLLSDVIADITGYPASEFIGNRVRPYASVIHPEDLNWVRKTVKKSSKEREPFTMEYRIVDAAGKVRWVHERGMGVLGEDGSVQYLDGAIFDITDRKLTDEALRESEGRYHTLFDAANDGIFIMKNDRIVDCNPRILEMFGLTREQIIGNKPYALSPEIQPEGITSKAKAHEKIKAVQGGEPQFFEWRHIRSDGNLFDTEVNLNLVQLGTQMHIMAIVRDITDRKRAEEEKARLTIQLIQAQKMEAIGTLAGGIAHDFNNILSAIIGFTEISLRDVPSESKLEDNLLRILNAGIRARDLVKQILTFSRQTDRKVKKIQVKPIAQEALKFIRATIPATIEIRQDIKSDSYIMADPTQIHQIIMNLCTNASHAMQNEGGRMAVHLKDVELGPETTGPHPEVAPGTFVNLTVSDSGHGMPLEVQDRIFDPFFTTKEPGKGTGLGLSVVHGVVKDCGGFITVDSTPGEGATLNVFFPLVEGGRKAEMAARSPLPTGTERILFVDDEEYQAEMGKQVFELLGYRVIALTSSQEALKVFKERPDRFDLVITDLTMPNLTGDELAKEIKAIRSDTPIILCTGYSEKILPERVEELGISEVVLKPTIMEEIARIVRNLLDRTAKDRIDNLDR